MARRLSHINPPEIHPPFGYTHVVEVQPGRIAYISGQVAIDPAGNIVGEGDIVAQARQVFENLKLVLADLGADFGSVIKFNFYAVDASRNQAIRDVRNEYLGTNPPPASTFVIVKGLVRPELMIEIEAVAALPD
jgi:enamine deaminase RidA (YjgF/YER057c/UK114 family)